ncbi:hypothetical protein B7463_g8249, partial [Scytalidium lignicola]
MLYEKEKEQEHNANDLIYGASDILLHTPKRKEDALYAKGKGVNHGNTCKKITITEVYNMKSLASKLSRRFRFNLQDNVNFNYFIIVDVFYIDIEIHDLDKDIALQMVFKAVNDSVGPDRLVLTLLVYSAYPCMSELDTLALIISQRVMVIKKAMEEISKIKAKRQVQDVINMHNSLDVRTEARKGYTSLSTVVKPYLTPTEGIDGIELPKLEPGTTANEEHQEKPNESTIAVALPPVPPVKQRHGRPRKYLEITVFLQDKEPEPQFVTSCQVEISGLLEKGVFKTVDPQNIPNDIHIFNTRFMDEIKNKGTEKAFEKSRLVVQAYKDDKKKLVLT